jgi:hypothetical protein
MSSWVLECLSHNLSLVSLNGGPFEECSVSSSLMSPKKKALGKQPLTTTLPFHSFSPNPSF